MIISLYKILSTILLLVNVVTDYYETTRVYEPPLSILTVAFISVLVMLGVCFDMEGIVLSICKVLISVFNVQEYYSMVKSQLVCNLCSFEDHEVLLKKFDDYFGLKRNVCTVLIGILYLQC